ncbi:PIN domain nuclease [soil metagenome]
MAAVARYVADTSALARLRHDMVVRRLGPLMEAGLVATCAVVDYEMLWSTRSADEYDDVRHDREVGYERLSIEDVDWQRALYVQGELWRAGRHRSVPLPDLLLAAVTGQPTEWIVTRGNVV